MGEEDAWAGPDTNAVAGTVKTNMIYKIEMEFAGGVESQYRDVYLGFEHLPCLQTVLIGNQKIFLYNITAK